MLATSRKLNSCFMGEWTIKYCAYWFVEIVCFIYVLSFGLRKGNPLVFSSDHWKCNQYLTVWIMLTTLRKLDSCFMGEWAIKSCIFWFVDVLCFIYKWYAIVVIGWCYIMIVIEMLDHYLWVSFPFTLCVSPKFTTCICFLLGVQTLPINFLGS